MLDILKKNSRKSFITRAIIGAIVAVIMLAITRFAIFDVITGPTELDLTASPENYDGKYVTIEVENFLTDYVEHSTTTKNTKTGSESTSVDGNSYIVFNAVNDYANNSATWYYYSIYMDKKHLDDLYGRIDDTWEYWADETNTVAPPEPITVTGTWTRLESELEQYYNETLTEMGIEAGDYDVVYYFTVDSANLGGAPIGVFWVLNVIALLSLIFMIISIVGMFGNAYAVNIHKFIQNNPTLSLATIESDFNQAHKIGKKAWVGKSWTVYISGVKANILSNKDLVWAYYFRRTGKNAVSQLQVFTIDKKMFAIPMSESEAQEALSYYAAEQPQMVTGYNADLEKTYQKQFTDFLNLKYNPAKNAEQTDAAFNSSYYDTANYGTSGDGSTEKTNP